MPYRVTWTIHALGWLYVVTSASMLIAPWFAFTAPGGWSAASGVLALGVLVAATGVGLLRAAAWAWPVALLIAASGAIVVAGRLRTGGPWASLVPVLLTNLLSLAALVHARGATRPAAVHDA